MTHEGSLWCQLLLFQFGICPHGFPALLSVSLSGWHNLYVFTECVLITYFPYAFTPGFLNSGTLDLLDQMVHLFSKLSCLL